MNKFLKFIPMAAIVAIPLTLCSCSDDDDNDGPNPPLPPTGQGTADPSQVFTSGIPLEVGKLAIVTNAQGLVQKMVKNSGGYDQTTYTFTYGNQATETATPGYKTARRPTDYDILVTVTETNDREVEYFYITLGSNGFAKQIVGYDSDNDSETWDFDYDHSGHLTYMKRSDGREETRITYTDGDITSVKMTSPDPRDYTAAEIAYVNSTVTAPIANQGNLMFFEDNFGIDMDDVEELYYAGLLGKATAHLPLQCTERDDDGVEVTQFSWNILPNGLPTSMSIQYPYGSTFITNIRW